MSHRITPVKDGEPGLEFLVVGNDANAFKVLNEAIRNVHGRLNCASSASAAMDYLTRRKADGIVIDMSLPGAMDLVACVRTGSSNKLSVVFACIGLGAGSEGCAAGGRKFHMEWPA